MLTDDLDTGCCGDGSTCTQSSSPTATTQDIEDLAGRSDEVGHPQRHTHVVSPSFLMLYEKHVKERARMVEDCGSVVPPKPLDAKQTKALIEELKQQDIPETNQTTLIDLLSNRVPPGVDEASYVKASYLSDIAIGKELPPSPLLTRERAIELLGTMQGGYNVSVLIKLLQNPSPDISGLAAEQLKHTLLVFDAFGEIEKLHKEGLASATAVMESWAKAEWFLEKPPVPDKITVTVFKVKGETNTDDLSPAQDAWSRPDIPLHAMSMLKNPREGIEPVIPGKVGPIKQLQELKAKGFPLAYVGDVVGTGSSRKSGTNSVLWHMGHDIPHVPNIKAGGVCLGGKIAPIFFNTMEDSGALPIELDVSELNMGDIIDIYVHEGKVRKHKSPEQVVATFHLHTPVLLDEVRAGGRIPLIIGRHLTGKARASLNDDSPITDIFQMQASAECIPAGFTLAQKIVGRACGLKGVAPGQYCEPIITTVGSQDSTGPMTRDELRLLACLDFSADLVMQSFCHTAAYPKPVDVEMHNTLPGFIRDRGGVSLKPGDGIIHSWLNKMVLPDTVGTGGDSHTRFPIGISFPAGSGLVAFAAATGTMPLDMPESVLVKFTGTIQPGITLRDLVQSIPYVAKQKGLVTVGKEGKKNVFSGRILEIEGLPRLTCEQAFEFSASTAERSAAACTIKLDKEPVIRYVKSNVVLLKTLITTGYGDVETLKRRIARMENWLADPVLLEADPDAEYADVVEINMDEIKEPVLAAPNDPDKCCLLSQVAGTPVDEVFIGSCMTSIEHFRTAGKILDKIKKPVPSRLWITPPTKMDAAKLREEGWYNTFGAKAGARTEIPGCSLCMGNQARVAAGTTVVSTSTRNFPNRMGQDTKVYLASAELAVMASMQGHMPSVEEYMKFWKEMNETADSP